MITEWVLNRRILKWHLHFGYIPRLLEYLYMSKKEYGLFVTDCIIPRFLLFRILFKRRIRNESN